MVNELQLVIIGALAHLVEKGVVFVEERRDALCRCQKNGQEVLRFVGFAMYHVRGDH